MDGSHRRAVTYGVWLRKRSAADRMAAVTVPRLSAELRQLARIEGRVAVRSSRRGLSWPACTPGKQPCRIMPDVPLRPFRASPLHSDKWGRPGIAGYNTRGREIPSRSDATRSTLFPDDPRKPVLVPIPILLANTRRNCELFVDVLLPACLIKRLKCLELGG